MNSSLSASTSPSPQSAKAAPRSRGWEFAPYVWWVIFGAVIWMNLLAIAPTYQFWQRECVIGECYDMQLRLFQLRAWLAMGFTREAYAALALASTLLPAAVYILVGLILFRAKPRDGMVYFTSLTLVLFGGVTYSGILGILARENPLWWYPVLALDLLGSVFIIAFFYVFPNGHFAPRWMRYVLALYALEQVLELLNNPPINLRFMPEIVVDGAFILSVLSVVATQVYRYRRVATPAERRQTKWVVYATSLALIGFIGSALLFVSIQALYENVLAEVMLTFLLAVLISVIPISIAIAMLRARLWDIDLIINRTIVYGAMTAIVAGLLAVLSDLARKFFLALTGETSELAPIVATLLIVALFEPIRKRVQGFVDRHFKYATGTLGAFGDKVSEFVQMNDAHALARRFLQETLTSFDVASGAVYLGEGNAMQLVASAGNWSGHGALGVPLEYAGKRVGLIALAARKNGDAYSEQDRAGLDKIAAVVAHAIVLAETLKQAPVQAST